MGKHRDSSAIVAKKDYEDLEREDYAQNDQQEEPRVGYVPTWRTPTALSGSSQGLTYRNLGMEWNFAVKLTY